MAAGETCTASQLHREGVHRMAAGGTCTASQPHHEGVGETFTTLCSHRVAAGEICMLLSLPSHHRAAHIIYKCLHRCHPAHHEQFDAAPHPLLQHNLADLVVRPRDVLMGVEDKALMGVEDKALMVLMVLKVAQVRQMLPPLYSGDMLNNFYSMPVGSP